MNKEIIDCIKVEKEKELAKRKEKEEKIEKIKEFFKELPAGTYEIDLVEYVETKKKSHWYSKPYTYDKAVLKELWGKDMGGDWVQVSVDRSINIDKGFGNRIHGQNIERWADNEIEVFYDHLDWFEKELGKEYCK